MQGGLGVIHPLGHTSPDNRSEQTLGANHGCPPVISIAGVPLGETSQDRALTTRNPRPVCIHHGGRRFVASAEMAGIFLRHAQRLIDDGDTQLVPLLHREGVELLLVSAATPLSVHFAAPK